MKTTFLILIISLYSLLTFGQNYTLTVTITDIKNNEGVVMIKLMDSNEKLVKGLEGKIADKKCTVKIENLKAGTYALSFFHDANSNGKLDMKSWGPPAEGYGYSNDARGFMGPAKFKDQLFEINSDLTITLETDN